MAAPLPPAPWAGTDAAYDPAEGDVAGAAAAGPQAAAGGNEAYRVGPGGAPGAYAGPQHAPAGAQLGAAAPAPGPHWPAHGAGAYPAAGPRCAPPRTCRPGARSTPAGPAGQRLVLQAAAMRMRDRPLSACSRVGRALCLVRATDRRRQERRALRRRHYVCAGTAQQGVWPKSEQRCAARAAAHVTLAPA